MNVFDAGLPDVPVELRAPLTNTAVRTVAVLFGVRVTLTKYQPSMLTLISEFDTFVNVFVIGMSSEVNASAGTTAPEVTPKLYVAVVPLEARYPQPR